eukprot:GDKJ01049182.1.p1 GENE.GDKJ01049182.1~~GDKJ01049182.1.p1  ORF type:complete len:535 (-),score=151.21 GDKJ01049182.1:379-1983(-)
MYDEWVSLTSRFGGEIDACDDTGRTRLHVAAFNGLADIVNGLIDVGCDVNYVDIKGWSALHVAICRGHTAIVEILLKAGADVNAALGHSLKPIRNGPVNSYPIHFAAMKGDLLTTQLLLNHHAQLNATDSQGLTPLHYAVARPSNLEYVRWLLTVMRVDPLSRDNNNRTALHVVSTAGHLEIAKLLLRYVPPRALMHVDRWDLSPLVLAESCEHKELQKFFEDVLQKSESAAIQEKPKIDRNYLLGLAPPAQSANKVRVTVTPSSDNAEAASTAPVSANPGPFKLVSVKSISTDSTNANGVSLSSFAVSHAHNESTGPDNQKDADVDMITEQKPSTARVFEPILPPGLQRTVCAASPANLPPALPDEARTLTDAEVELLLRVTVALQEPKYRQLERILRRLGAQKLIDLHDETTEIEAAGGQMVEDGSRRKTFGGVFFTLLRDRVRKGEVSKEDFDWIRMEDKERNLALRRLKKRHNSSNSQRGEGRDQELPDERRTTTPADRKKKGDEKSQGRHRAPTKAATSNSHAAGMKKL